MILGVPVNGAALLVLAAGISIASYILGARDLVSRILGTVTAPCAEVCTVCCDPVEPYTGLCSCDDDEPNPARFPLGRVT